MAAAATDADKPEPSWVAWVAKNSKPKNFCFPRERPPPSRWRKRGPMKGKDWKRFFRWCETRCLPVDHSPKPPPVEYDKRGRPILPEEPEIDVEAQQEYCKRLAVPKSITPKFQLQSYILGPFRPTFDPKKPAKREKGRPFKQPKIPCCFPNEEIRGFFWATYRYNISKNALKAKAKPRTVQLAMPKRLPEVPHCEIPVVLPEVIPPRVKMSYKQWKGHLRRLEYLAKPREHIEVC